MLGFGLGLRGGRGASPGPAAIFGATSYADLMFADMGRLWQDSVAASPVTAQGQPVGLVSGLGSAGGQALQATASQRPTWQGSHAEFDGVDDYLDLNAAARDITRNASGLTLWTVFRPASVAFMALIGVSTTGATTPRVLLQVLSTGALRLSYRREDGDGSTVVDSAAGVVGAGLDHAVVLTLDFAGGGSEALRVWLNGMPVISAAISGTGNTSDTAAARGRVGGSLSGAPPTPLTAGRIYRCGLARRACSAAEAQLLTTSLQGGIA